MDRFSPKIAQAWSILSCRVKDDCQTRPGERDGDIGLWRVHLEPLEKRLTGCDACSQVVLVISTELDFNFLASRSFLQGSGGWTVKNLHTSYAKVYTYNLSRVLDYVTTAKAMDHMIDIQKTSIILPSLQQALNGLRWYLALGLRGVLALDLPLVLVGIGSSSAGSGGLISKGSCSRGIWNVTTE